MPRERRADSHLHGLPPGAAEKLFDPFVQLGTDRSGSGLGLSICRSVLWEVDGTLSIQSEPGNGTDVRVLVPQVLSRQSPQWT